MIPVTDSGIVVADDKKETVRTRHEVYFLPEKLRIEGNLDSTVRHKGIYNVELYIGKFEIKGFFDNPDFSRFTFNNPEFLFDEAEVILGLGDTRALSRKVMFEWNGREYPVTGGTGETVVFSSGISAEVEAEKDKANSFTFSMILKGGEGISFYPAGNETIVFLQYL